MGGQHTSRGVSMHIVFCIRALLSSSPQELPVPRHVQARLSECMEDVEDKDKRRSLSHPMGGRERTSTLRVEFMPGGRDMGLSSRPDHMSYQVAHRSFPCPGMYRRASRNVWRMWRK